MSWTATFLRALRLRTPWVVALCYALLVQAALAPVVASARDRAAHGDGSAVLCLSDQRDGVPAHDGGAHHDMGCCLPSARTLFLAPALVAGDAPAIPEAPGRVAGIDRPAAPARAPPSVDLPTRAARAPPSLLV